MAAWTAPGAGAREFRAADTQAENYPTVQALRYMGRQNMGRLIAERTGGRHQLKAFHSRQLGEETETIERAPVGAIDLTRTNAFSDTGARSTYNAVRPVKNLDDLKGLRIRVQQSELVLKMIRIVGAEAARDLAAAALIERIRKVE
jgi:TRAP-type C4-dicarboxylate transport system substrate-binding protein